VHFPQNCPGILVFVLHNTVLQIGHEIGARLLESQFAGGLMIGGTQQYEDFIGTYHTVKAVFVEGMGTKFFKLAEYPGKVFGVFGLVKHLYIGSTFCAERYPADKKEIVSVLHTIGLFLEIITMACNANIRKAGATWNPIHRCSLGHY